MIGWALAAALLSDELLRRRSFRDEPYLELATDLFRSSGVNAEEPWKVAELASKMTTMGWTDDIPPLHGWVSEMDEDDVESYAEAEEEGYEHELAWSRPISKADLGKLYLTVEDGNHRAKAALAAGLPLRVRLLDEQTNTFLTYRQVHQVLEELR